METTKNEVLDKLKYEFSILKETVQASKVKCDEAWCKDCPYRQFLCCNGELS